LVPDQASIVIHVWDGDDDMPVRRNCDQTRLSLREIIIVTVLGGVPDGVAGEHLRDHLERDPTTAGDCVERGTDIVPDQRYPAWQLGRGDVEHRIDRGQQCDLAWSG
jgi:hypothetical protein